MIRVAINGYGRIGRVAHRIILEKFSSKVEVVAINAGSSTDITGWMYLLKYDTAYGPLLGHSISSEESLEEGSVGSLVIDGKKIPVFETKDSKSLPWKKYNVDVVIESTGHIKGKSHIADELGVHIEAGARAVVLSAPVDSDEVETFVLSVNADKYNGETVISNASCTTNCIAPVAKIIEDHFGIEKAMMTTVHAYTSDQRLQDGGHKDYRRARAAGQNIIPTSTGAATAAAIALPSLKDKFSGLSLRVPVVVGSLSDITFLTKKTVTKEEVNAAIKEEVSGAYKGIVDATADPIVSSDIIGNPHSAIVDLGLTQVVGGNMVKVIAWYDNEYGYANRLIEEVLMMGKSEARSTKSETNPNV